MSRGIGTFKNPQRGRTNSLRNNLFLISYIGFVEDYGKNKKEGLDAVPVREESNRMGVFVYFWDLKVLTKTSFALERNLAERI